MLEFEPIPSASDSCWQSHLAVEILDEIQQKKLNGKAKIRTLTVCYLTTLTTDFPKMQGTKAKNT